MKNLVHKIKFGVLAVVLGLSLNYVFATFGPQGNPPGNMPETLITQSNVSQAKNGPILSSLLNVDQGTTVSTSALAWINTFVKGNVQINSLSPSAKVCVDAQHKLITCSTPVTATATLSASQSTIASGGSAVLTWTSANTTACTGTGFSTGASNATSNSTGVTVNPTTTTTYTLNCTGGSAASSVTIVVTPPNIPSVTLTANPSSSAGATTRLRWTSSNVTACTGTGFSTGASSPVQSTGSGVVGSMITNQVTTTFSITCTGPNGNATDSVVVTRTLCNIPDHSCVVGATMSGYSVSGVNTQPPVTVLDSCDASWTCSYGTGVNALHELCFDRYLNDGSGPGGMCQ